MTNIETDPLMDEVVGGVWLPEAILERDTPEPSPKGPNFLERHKVAIAAAGTAAVFITGVVIRGVKEAVTEPQTA